MLLSVLTLFNHSYSSDKFALKDILLGTRIFASLTFNLVLNGMGEGPFRLVSNELGFKTV